MIAPRGVVVPVLAALALGLAALALALAACGKGEPSPQDGAAGEVRRAADRYLAALRAREWPDACALMTPAARRALETEFGRPCARALAEGGAAEPDELDVMRRRLPGARVDLRGSRATLASPLSAGGPLRLEQVTGRWLVAG